MASASELGDDLYKQLDTKKKELDGVLSNRDTSSFAVQQLLRLKESKLSSKEAEVQTLQKKMAAQTTMMDALEGALAKLPLAASTSWALLDSTDLHHPYSTSSSSPSCLIGRYDRSLH